MAAPATPTGTSATTTPQATPAGGTPPTAAPAAQPPEAAPAAQAAPAVQPEPKAKGDDVDPDWLSRRLDRERKGFLKKMGWEGSDEDAKAALNELKTRRDAEKTELQKAQDEVKTLSGVKGERDTMAKVIAERAKVEMAALSNEQRVAIQKLAGDDAAAQLRSIDAFKPTWAAPAAATPGDSNGDDAAAAPAAQGTAPVPAPASSMPTEGAPTGAPPTGEENHLAVYEELNKANPVRAARYYVMHQESIVHAQRASS